MSNLVVMLVILAAITLPASIIIRRNETSNQRLRQSEEPVQAILNSVNVAIIIYDPRNRNILDINHKMQETFGYTRQEALHLDIIAISSGIPPYQPETVEKWVKKAPIDEPQFFEWQAKDKSGRVFWVDVNIAQVIIGGQSRVVISIRDITEKKQAEEKFQSLKAELEQQMISRTAALEAANKELEAFAYSVSHDLRAPLCFLDGFSSILLEDYRDKLDEQGQQYLVRIRRMTQRMGQLINDLRNLSCITHAEFTCQQVNLSSLAREIAAELQDQCPNHRRVEWDISSNLMVNVNANLIKIVMENLLNNAFKFTGKREKSTIQVGVIDQHGENIYYVRDNGSGFSMEYANKLFIPFQRLHNENEFPGTGIGLAIVKRIINRHGGRIWAEAAVGQGATFYFTLQ